MGNDPAVRDTAVLIPAAGLGIRLGPGEPKALREFGGASLLAHAVRRLAQASCVGEIVVAAPDGRVDEVRGLLAPLCSAASVELAVVAGGATRQDSVRAALHAASPRFPIVLVHDAARALAPTDLAERVAAAVRAGHPAVVPTLPVVDTVKTVDTSGHVLATVDRTTLHRVQTPQGFRRDVLDSAHARPPGFDTVTDDAGLVEKIGVAVFCVPGSASALKITTPLDLTIAQALLAGDDAAERAGAGGALGRTLR